MGTVAPGAVRLAARAGLTVLALAAGAGIALAQQGGRATKPPPEKPQTDRSAAKPVVACPSLANYRILMRGGAAAGAAVLSDPRADHLGCAVVPLNRFGAVTERVTLGGATYACVAVQGTTACHWLVADTAQDGR